MDGETYIGDGVYASYDGYQIRLRCAAPSQPNIIYLDGSVYASLLRFVEKINESETAIRGELT